MILALAVAGCNRDQVKVQEVPKDATQTAPMQLLSQPANPHAGMDMGAAPAPATAKLKWTLPAGWKEKELSGMRAGSFDAGEAAAVADVSIIPLASMNGPGMELANFNMWREALQLPAADKVQSEPVTFGPGQGKLYEVADPKSPDRIIAAVLDRDGMSWYFKIKGPDAVVTAQKAAFLEFLKSVSFEAAPAAMAANPHANMPGMNSSAPVVADAAPTVNAAGISVPAGWKEIANPSMLLAKYVISGAGGAEASVNVTMLNLSGGGVLVNVNRWRGQLGLPQTTEEEFAKVAQAVDVAGVKATLADLNGTDPKTGKKARLFGIIVPQTEGVWFYKLSGDPDIVAQQKDTFLKFVQTAKFPNAN